MKEGLKIRLFGYIPISAEVSLEAQKSLRGNISKAFFRRVELPVWMSEG